MRFLSERLQLMATPKNSLSNDSHGRASEEEFRAVLDALASKAPNVLQLRNETFSREMIYGEHA
jgi:hypothetical protein